VPHANQRTGLERRQALGAFLILFLLLDAAAPDGFVVALPLEDIGFVAASDAGGLDGGHACWGFATGSVAAGGRALAQGGEGAGGIGFGCW
jgi:hypothetical protein